MSLSVSVKNSLSFADSSAVMPDIATAHETLLSGTGRGNDFLGWVRLPFNYDKEEFKRVKAAAKRIREQSDLLIVIGIGGSYLGARAAIEYISSPNYNMFRKSGTPMIVFAGNSISSDQAQEIIDLASGMDFSVNVISKSGTTTEPAISFRIFKALAEERYGAGAKDRIYATTDAARGALKTLADAAGYECFVIPDNVGGRFSVLTPVGLLPIAVAGIDIDSVMQGAADMAEKVQVPGEDNPAWQYAAARNALYRKGYTTEIIAAYEPRFRYMGEWWKQLYGESEGKELKGIFPASVDLTADLHSMGQYIQQGMRNIFETVVGFESFRTNVTVPDGDKLDGLDFLVGRPLCEINDMAAKGTALAHVDGGVPNLSITVEKADAYSFGELVYFFEFACGLSGYTLGVNPFDQPGVEAYKKNMFALIGKPGYEDMRKELLERL